MRILVTGANGQLGNEMQVLAKENPQHTYYFTDVQELDICDKQAVWTYMAEKQIELVVNCAAYFKALPFIVELRNKNGKKDEPELETCFEALYGVLLLRLQKKSISEGTAKAVEAITSFLSMLANYYDNDRKGELKLDE